MEKKQPPSRLDALNAVRTLIAYMGDDPDRAGVQDTPRRFICAWEDAWGAGYQTAPPELTKFFSREGNQDEMVLVRDIAVHSHCEHHLAPFFGACTIGYIPDPNRGILGLSKFARIVNHFSRRLQVQERLTTQIADYFVKNISANVAVVMRCSHMCMFSRGVRESNSTTSTTALRGVFFNERQARDEFLREAQK